MYLLLLPDRILNKVVQRDGNSDTLTLDFRPTTKGDPAIQRSQVAWHQVMSRSVLALVAQTSIMSLCQTHYRT